MHLHVHTEYSMLDGAARLKDLFAAVRADRHAGRRHHRPRQRLRRLRLLGQGDGGRHQADHRHRGLRGARAPPAPAAGALGDPGAEGRRRLRRRCLHAHDAARRDHRGHAQPVPAVLAGLAGGLLPQAPDGPRTAGGPLQGDHRHHRLPVRRGADQAPARPVRQALEAAAAYRDIFGPGNFFVEIMDHGLPIEQRVRDGLRRIAQRAVAAVRRHQRLALQPAGGRHRARGAALRADRHQPGRPRPVQVRGHRLLPQEPAGDAGGEHRRGMAGGLRHHPADRRAGRRQLRQGEPDAPVPGAGRRDRGELLPGGGLARDGPALPGRLRRAAPRAGRVRDGHHRRDGVLLVLPGGRRLHHVGQEQRDQGRARTRLGGGQPGVLRARHHRPRPDRARAGVRAVPQPRARVHARHRHRLRRAPARRRHPVRHREVRRRPGRPDHHLRHDQGQGRGQGLDPRARVPLRARRPDHQGVPARR